MKIQIESYHIPSNFAVSNIRYDVILGMPQHKNFKPFINSEDGEVIVNKNSLPRKEENSKVEVLNLSIKKFYFLLPKSHESFDLQTVTNLEIATSDAKSKLVRKSPRLEKILKNYSPVFQEKLPCRLLPKGNVEHVIEVENGTEPLYRSLFQLSLAELVATK